MENIGCKIIVTGKVQGVGFRYFTFKEAIRSDLSGHAKNLSNGDVEILLYGDRGKIDKMLKWIEKGSKTSRVDDVDMTLMEYVNKGRFVCY